jgi:hypothetical protein
MTTKTQLDKAFDTLTDDGRYDPTGDKPYALAQGTLTLTATDTRTGVVVKRTAHFDRNGDVAMLSQQDADARPSALWDATVGAVKEGR